MNRKVTFSPNNETIMIDRPTANEILNLYYQDQDYKQFRRKEIIRDIRKRNSKDTRRRRDSLNNMVMNPCKKICNNGSEVQGMARSA
mmetsp:Transcript_30936/g.46947  ORF Transcript_30936/g.46947 Transcript_30936/m.46947 type:complete len:87 (-) Transcript_30936:56-316(-)